MKKTFEELVRHAKGIRLNASEKTSAKEALVSFMESHPFESRSAPSRFIVYARRTLAAFGASALLVGTVSYAAEKSLPGDTLYPIKVNINERVVTLATLSPEKSAAWQSRIISRRLEEAESLTSNGSLDAEKLAEMEARIDTASEKVTEHINEFEKEKDLETAATVSSNLESSLRAHEKILLNLSTPKLSSDQIDTDAKNEDRQPSFVETIKKRRDQIALRRDAIESHITTGTKNAVSTEKISAEQKAIEVKNLIESLKTSLGSESSEEAKARLTLALKTIEEGNAKSDMQSSGDAFRLYQKAGRALEEARLLLEAHKKFNIHPNFNGRRNDDENSIDNQQDDILEGTDNAADNNNARDEQESKEMEKNDNREFQNQKGQLQFDTGL
ncbi:MAG TPA: DUF5667 domain-containing protein [Candidatus Paceibacterota bacterium]